ncbi:type I phosphomannose isomerase catalytic subunit [Ruficoccus sp. ZRK36]|uniref:type I phosphomannose isomerase catalytic subunit n=1 Tax=Ruficoccus sp. ZRK36 TaxID=2866311 RepID=UPI001C72D7BE|nr:type I phosphomannose isomerase catalytic subunit [Ruficoccus sp. ZRK36]QYY36815.1 class I mannose-6-phosphate isomerase [Ruficoccus sp. ZRK36]
MRFYAFKPIYQERVWGGRGLADQLGRALPGEAPIGESWEIVDRPEAQSVVAEGPQAGLTLRELVEKHADTVMGPGYDASTPFPILVKWLDCQDRLSLQVHPPADIAPSLGGEPKTENWYVAEAEPHAAMLIGLKNGVTREEFETALRENRAEPLVHRIPAKKGESMFVRSGRLHALDAGCLILEIQQNSDTTYRVYDWGRVGLDGQPRQLHIEESLKCIEFNDYEPDLLRPVGDKQVIAESELFNITRYTLRSGQKLEFPAGEQPRLIGVVDGALRDCADETTIGRSANVLLPYAESFTLEAIHSPTTVLVTDGFGGA